MDKCNDNNPHDSTVNRPCFHMELSRTGFDVSDSPTLYKLSRYVLWQLSQNIVHRERKNPSLNELAACARLRHVYDTLPTFSDLSFSRQPRSPCFWNRSRFWHVEASDFDFLYSVGYHRFEKFADRTDWHSIACIVKSLKESPEYLDHWFKFANGDKHQIIDSDDPPLHKLCLREQAHLPNPILGYEWLTSYERMAFMMWDEDYFHIHAPTSGPSREIGRVIRFDNGLVVKYYCGARKYVATIDHQLRKDLEPLREYEKLASAQSVDEPDLSRLLLEQGIEPNPGPVRSYSPEEELEHKCAELTKMMKELRVYKKKEKKQSNCLQRALEVEKSKRNRKRKQAAIDKRHAQGVIDLVKNLTSDAQDAVKNPKFNVEVAKTAAYLGANAICPGVGTAAAVLVNGAKLSSAANQLEPTLSLAQQLLQSLVEVSDDLKNMFKIPEDVDFVSILVTLASICSALLSKQLFILTMHCMNLARQLKVSFDSLLALIPNFESASVFFSSPATPQVPTPAPVPVSQSLIADMLATAQDSTELIPFSGLLSFVCGIFSLLCCGVLPTPIEMTKHFASIGRAAQGFRSVKDLFSWMYTYLSEIYYKTVYGLSSEEYQFLQNFPALENLYAASKIIETFGKPLLDASAPLSNQVLTVNKNLAEYHYQATRMNSRTNVNLVTSLQKRIHDQVRWATSSPARCQVIREAPFAIYLYGHPGIGKSVATEVIKARIFKEYLKSKCKFENCAFPRRAKNEYWEGYTGQPIVILDDFGNTKDSQMKPVEELEELLYMVNTAQYPLKMAELSQKGVCNFTSEFIVASSNLQYPDVKSLNDPGAVFRRFHIWADVKIDPKYGVATGKDNQGQAYYQYDKATVANLKGCSKKEVEPLMTEHYRFSCYKVTQNMQTGNAEVVLFPRRADLTMDEFWDFITEMNAEYKDAGKDLASAVRKEAGIPEHEVPPTEQEYIDQFDAIFNPEKFIDDCADAKVCEKPVPTQTSPPTDSAATSPPSPTPDKKKKKKAAVFDTRDLDTAVSSEGFWIWEGWEFDEGDTATYTDAVEEDLFGEMVTVSKWEQMKAFIAKKFTSFKEKCSNLMSKFYHALKKKTTSLFTSIAEFIMSILSAAADKISTYLPSMPQPPMFNLIKISLFAMGGLWCATLFRRYFAGGASSWCSFAMDPDDASTPCSECGFCKILEFPKYGDMLEHYLERTAIKSVRKDLLEYISADKLEEARERGRVALAAARIVRKERAAAIIQGFRECGCPDCAHFIPENTAQRAYEQVVRPGQTHHYAQRVYESQPQVPRPHRYAQGVTECKTEMEIGARRYAQKDVVQIQQTTQVLLKNAVWVQAADEDGLCSRSNGVFLVGRTMLTTAHTILNPPKESPVKYIYINNPYSTEATIRVPIEHCQITQLTQKDGTLIDLCLVSFPAVVPNRPKILSKFVNAEDIDRLKEGELIWSGFYQVNGKTVVQEKYPSHFQISTKATQYWLHGGVCPITKGQCTCPVRIGNHIEYDLETQDGTCGALIAIENNLVHTKLIGLHVAGGKGSTALGVLTTRQLLTENLDVHIKKYDIPQSYLLDGRMPYSQSWVSPEFVSSLVHEGDCLSIGKAPAPSAPTQTQLGPSLIFGKIQAPITRPALLKSVVVGGVVVDPMVRGIKKVLGPQTWIDPDLLDIAANDVFNNLDTSESRRVLTYEEAIRGVTDDPYKRPINRTTSPGYPYNMSNPSKGKTFWLGSDEEYIVDNEELRSDVEQLLERARKGERGDAISIATLKDEKRPHEKVDACKTRVFEACPQHLVIAIRQYFLDFAAQVMKHRIDNGITVGINPYSLEWTKLAHHLLKQGNQMIAGDFTNFDGSLHMQVLVKIVEKINEWYGDSTEDQLVRCALWEHISNADILVKGEVIRKTHSQPSGNPLTVIINSLFNAIVMRVAYLILKKRNGLPMVCDYRKYVSEAIYGDDDVKSVSPAIASWFTQLTLTQALASIGLTYTDESKTGSIVPFKTLQEVAFLKRRFAIQSDGTYLSPMSLENVLEMTNWIKGKQRRAATLENCQMALTELALHPRHVYESEGSRMRKELLKVDIVLDMPTYSEQMEILHHTREQCKQVEYAPIW